MPKIIFERGRGKMREFQLHHHHSRSHLKLDEDSSLSTPEMEREFVRVRDGGRERERTPRRPLSPTNRRNERNHETESKGHRTENELGMKIKSLFKISFLYFVSWSLYSLWSPPLLLPSKIALVLQMLSLQPLFRFVFIRFHQKILRVLLVLLFPCFISFPLPYTMLLSVLYFCLISNFPFETSSLIIWPFSYFFLVLSFSFLSGCGLSYPHSVLPPTFLSSLLSTCPLLYLIRYPLPISGKRERREREMYLVKRKEHYKSTLLLLRLQMREKVPLKNEKEIHSNFSLLLLSFPMIPYFKTPSPSLTHSDSGFSHFIKQVIGSPDVRVRLERIPGREQEMKDYASLITDT